MLFSPQDDLRTEAQWWVGKDGAGRMAQCDETTKIDGTRIVEAIWLIITFPSLINRRLEFLPPSALRIQVTDSSTLPTSSFYETFPACFLEIQYHSVHLSRVHNNATQILLIRPAVMINQLQRRARSR